MRRTASTVEYGTVSGARGSMVVVHGEWSSRLKASIRRSLPVQQHQDKHPHQGAGAVGWVAGKVSAAVYGHAKRHWGGYYRREGLAGFRRDGRFWGIGKKPSARNRDGTFGILGNWIGKVGRQPHTPHPHCRSTLRPWLSIRQPGSLLSRL
jgi:hypothetical protein